jgi:polysaccharide deacetylase family protein (PEP-CTERM system associated)
MSDIINGLSVDVEDYYHVSAFENHISRNDWDSLPSRVEKNVDDLLELFSGVNVKATFFVLGWVAERYPGMVRRIIEQGHELASHGYSHIRITNHTPESFFQDIDNTKKILEDAGGINVSGFRAASYSITAETLWAHEIIYNAGYSYSSSVYPVIHDLYGIPDAPRFSYKVCNGNLLEIPISTYKFMNNNIPCGGGGYFRLFPYLLSRHMIRTINAMDGMPAIFYLHPWEIDVNQPRQEALPLKTRFRHYLNLDKMENRLKKLCLDFKWDRMDKVFSIQ